MLLRDALPTARVDVSVLFDRCLREQGIHTEYAGHFEVSPARAPTKMQGRLWSVGGRQNPWSVWRQLRLVWRIAGQFDLVVVRDKPIIAAAAQWLTRRRGVPCAYWMSFPIPAGDKIGAVEHYRNGLWMRAAFVWTRAHLAQWVLDRVVLPRCAHLFVQSDAMRRVILSSVSIDAESVSAVPMGVDETLLAAIRLEPVESPAGATVRPTIAYLGALDRPRRLNVLIDAFVRVKQKQPDARLWLIGASNHPGDTAWLKECARRAGVADAVEFRGSMPMANAWRLLRHATVCVSPVAPGPLYDVSSPTKMVEYLALGIPVVANDIPDQKLLLEQCGGGLCVPFEEAAFAEAILQLIGDETAARISAQASGKQVLQLRSYQVISAQVADTLRTVLFAHRGRHDVLPVKR
jgi:glycosyltransferase involved in cell wall biosynthesis